MGSMRRPETGDGGNERGDAASCDRLRGRIVRRSKERGGSEATAGACANPPEGVARATQAGEPSGAYYLAGYAVECGLKACIAKQVRRHEFPDRTTVNQSHTHPGPTRRSGRARPRPRAVARQEPGTSDQLARR